MVNIDVVVAVLTPGDIPVLSSEDPLPESNVGVLVPSSVSMISWGVLKWEGDIGDGDFIARSSDKMDETNSLLGSPFMAFDAATMCTKK